MHKVCYSMFILFVVAPFNHSAKLPTTGPSLGRDSQLFVSLLLLFGQCAEEADFLLARWLPLVVRFECALEMGLNIDIECLRFEARVRRVVDAWHGLGGGEMVQIASQLCELSPRCLLLPLLLILRADFVVLVQVLPDLLVLGLNMLQVLLSRVEVVLILPAVVATVTKDKESDP